MFANTCLVAAAAALAILPLTPQDDDSSPEAWVVYEGKEGPGSGKHVVLIAGDEEYRSEEALPMLARILAERHGFDCTVLFSTHAEDGTIDPTNQTNIPGMSHVANADLLVVFLRFRELPDEDMKYFVDYVESGKPIIGIRTATHAFQYKRNKTSPYERYTSNDDEWTGGFGRQILGDTWLNHHGKHGSQSTRGVVEAENAEHPILRGVDDVWGPTDVYGVRELPADAKVLLRGQVVDGMKPTDPPLAGPKNDPMMPIFWIREFEAKSGREARVACSTIGASVDFESEGLRRAFVNACYWGLGLEEKIPAKSDVEYVVPYAPTIFGFGKWRKGVRASDYAAK